MIRYGIAGFGLHGDKRLMPGFARAERSECVAIARRNADKARATAEKYGLRHWFATTEELCRCPEVDAVFVASPNSIHLPDTLAAIRHGKPVLLEKPMAMNAEEARQMAEAARAAKVKLGVAQVFRFEESTRRMRERIGRGELGEIVLARAEFCFQGRGHARSWMNDARVAGGGPIADIGIHCIDTLRFILDDEVTAVSAFTRADEESREVEASAVLNLQFARGTLATVSVSTRADYRTPLEFTGERAILRASDGLTVEHPVTIEMLRGGEIVKREEVSNQHAYAAQVDAFSDWLTGDLPFPAPGEDGVKNQMILDAAYRSAKSGKVETV